MMQFVLYKYVKNEIAYWPLSRKAKPEQFAFKCFEIKKNLLVNPSCAFKHANL